MHVVKSLVMLSQRLISQITLRDFWSTAAENFFCLCACSEHEVKQILMKTRHPLTTGSEKTIHTLSPALFLGRHEPAGILSMLSRGELWLV